MEKVHKVHIRLGWDKHDMNKNCDFPVHNVYKSNLGRDIKQLQALKYDPIKPQPDDGSPHNIRSNMAIYEHRSNSVSKMYSRILDWKSSIKLELPYGLAKDILRWSVPRSPSLH